MVEIEVGEDDVAHIPRRIAQGFHLMDRRFLAAEADVEHRPEGDAEPRMGVSHVLAAVAGVDEDEAVRRLDQLRRATELRQGPLAETVEQRPPAGQSVPQLR